MTRVAINLSVALLLAGLAITARAAERVDPAEVAGVVDRRLAEEIKVSPSAVAKPCDDTTFLRRATLDLIGRNPRVEEITAFTLDSDPQKRAKVVERLLSESAYGENWGRYWRDVIMYRRSEDRALLASQALTTYLTEELNKNTPWDALASSFITAEGDVTVNGATALLMAQQGRPEETVSEAARIFMGIQIQCAQCHDHPTDSWKREQFHELAAFLPRVSVRPVRDGEKRSFEVVANDNFPRNARAGNGNRFRGTSEHYMPDLENPGARGKLMTPVFFVTGQKMKLGAKDENRRDTLAKWMTAPKNEWFAKAMVNRLWSELVGEGFYEPVDDMGPERQCSAPQTLDVLSNRFVASGHDVKWLFTTIMATEAYQRQSQSRRTPDEEPFTHNVAQRLRGDQLYANLTAAIGLADFGGGRGRGAYGFRGGPRNVFNAVFGFDPSSPRDELAGSIPQALAMMNSPLINASINGRGRTALARMMSDIKDDRALVTELYLKTLAREPSESEIATCLAYVKEVKIRSEAFEDIQWSLVNSTEFLHRK